MDIILKYFPDLNSEQKDKFHLLGKLVPEWNAKINVISRKDIDALYEKHILHSMAIAKVIQFKAGTSILDVGTGGGFPGIPLAILFPECHFHLVDSVGKKIHVVENIAKELELLNVKQTHIRVEKIKDRYDFITSRAVTAFPKFVSLVKKNISREQQNELKNGILYLKGGEFEEELSPFKKARVYNIPAFFNEEFFETKKIIHLEL